VCPLEQVSHSTVRNKHVRYRACQLVAEILERLTEDISEDLWDELKVALLARLRDKMVPVRMQAARALSRLQVRAQAAVRFFGHRSCFVRRVFVGVCQVPFWFLNVPAADRRSPSRKEVTSPATRW
jgi:hypothetical protein